LETEARKCFTHWREFGGELKDIPIKTICITKHIISQKTQQYLKNLKVEYIEKYIQPIEPESGFFNMPIGCMMLEKMVETEYIIYLDLDMFLIQPIQLEYNSNLVLEEYDFKDDSIWKSHKIEINRYFGSDNNYINIEFIIARKKDNIFKRWFNKFNELYSIYMANYQQLSIVEIYILEEIFKRGTFGIYKNGLFYRRRFSKNVYGQNKTHYKKRKYNDDIQTNGRSISEI
jgi:hypothetical protein